MNTNVKAIDLTRLGIKPESIAPEADALTTRPFEQLNPREPGVPPEPAPEQST